MVKLFFDKGWAPRRFDKVYFTAAKLGNIDIALYLFNLSKSYFNAPPNLKHPYNGKWVKLMLIVAAGNNQHELTKRLLDEGVPVNFEITYTNDNSVEHNLPYRTTALHAAAAAGHTKIVELLLARGATPDTGYNTALYSSKNPEIAKQLLDAKADINKQNGFRKATALHRAAIAGNEELVKFFLDNNANTDLKDDEKKTVYDLPTTDSCRKLLRYHIAGPHHLANFVFNRPVEERFHNLLFSSHTLEEWKNKMSSFPPAGLILYELINIDRINRNKDVIALMAQTGKEEVIAYIESLSNNRQLELVNEALKLGTPLNRFFYVKRGPYEPNENRGCLGHLRKLKDKLEKPNSISFWSLFCPFSPNNSTAIKALPEKSGYHFT